MYLDSIRVTQKTPINLLFSAMTSITYKLLVNLGITDILITCICGTGHVVQSFILGILMGYV